MDFSCVCKYNYVQQAASDHESGLAKLHGSMLDNSHEESKS